MNGLNTAITLSNLGPRIMIMGPSNSGKSTLAHAIAQARHLPAIHLDQLAHRPHTQWVRRPDGEFQTLHDRAILNAEWVIEGNYSFLASARFARATGLIILDTSTAVSLARYILRSCGLSTRIGGLSGARERIRWSMIKHIMITTRQNRRRYANDFTRSTLPKIYLGSRRALSEFYRRENLPHPHHSR